MAKEIILKNPRSLAAYFAIYQTINNSYIFSPYVKEDRAFCAAVATSFDTYMPAYERSKNLYALVMDAIKTERGRAQAESWKDIVENHSIGYIDIELYDQNDKLRKLSDNEGKVILLDFSAYSMQKRVQYIFELRELYNKYHNRGFEIYQISLDNSKLVWQQACENIPWISVRDENGINTQYVTSYNVQTVPTIFLINKKGEIVARESNFETLDKLISDNLR
jgi:glutathione peroxidase-family protein